MTQTEFHHAKPIFEYYDGWTENISDAKSLDELPENARKYVLKLEEISGCRIPRLVWARTATRPLWFATSSTKTKRNSSIRESPRWLPLQVPSGGFSYVGACAVHMIGRVHTVC